MTTTILSAVEAQSFVTSVINKYSSLHDLPILGSGVKQEQTPERISNRLSQQAYRNAHARSVIWHTTERQQIIDKFLEKLLILKNAKSDYKGSSSKYLSAQSLLAYTIANPPDLTAIRDESVKQQITNNYNYQITTLRTLVSQKQATLAIDLAAYNAAQIP